MLKNLKNKIRLDVASRQASNLAKYLFFKFRKYGKIN